MKALKPLAFALALAVSTASANAAPLKSAEPDPWAGWDFRTSAEWDKVLKPAKPTPAETAALAEAANAHSEIFDRTWMPRLCKVHLATKQACAAAEARERYRFEVFKAQLTLWLMAH